MNVETAIENRTAIRVFDAQHTMMQKEKQHLLELAMHAPSAWNIQHWRFILIENRDLRQSLSIAAQGQTQVTDAAMLVVITVDPAAWDKNPARYFSTLPDEVAEVLGDKVREFYKDRTWLARDDAMRSCGLASQTLMLAATAMGLGSCPMDLFDEDEVSKLLDLPAGIIPAMFVAIGKSYAEQGMPRAGRLPYDEVVMVDHFTQK